ncbi:hypothetical protein ACFQ5N_09190 [Lutibacter holmesii]|uniref:Holin-X, holin superfamily III n=1 Tax=Lutibacter holmesii TaxID=1137985 RepID=A0ABW3WR62_9FLAO
MKNLKNNIADISKNGESLIQNYLKLFGMRQSERLATFLGGISSVFLISVLLLIIIVFGSIVLADFLNSLFESKYMGFLLISILYLITVGILLLKMKATGKPLFTNLFMKFVLPLLNIDINQEPTVKGVEIERIQIEEKIENDKEFINVHTQLIKYAIFEDLFGVLTGFFQTKSDTEKQTNDKKESND